MFHFPNLPGQYKYLPNWTEAENNELIEIIIAGWFYYFERFSQVHMQIKSTFLLHIIDNMTYVIFG